MTLTTVRAVALAAAALFSLSAQAAQPAADHPAVARALAHLAAHAGLASTEDSYVAKDLVVDADGAEHVRLDRRHKSLRVIGGDLVVHSGAAGEFRGTSHSFAQPLSLDTQATVAAEEAQSHALLRFEHAGAQVESRELVIYARNGKPQLAWDISIHGTRADGTPSHAHLIIGARSNKLLDRWDDIHTANHVSTGKTLFAGDVSLNDTVNAKGTLYTLKDATRGGHYVLNMKNSTSGGSTMKGADTVWGNNTEGSKETVGADAAYGHQLTWDYYLNVHGRNGIADNGRGAYSRVHYSSNYDNAFWDDSCFCMTYGDGKILNPLVSIDVAGHEMTHGVTSRTAGLIYSGESGGLNEATSDIFGAMVEFYANNSNDVGDYLIGEKLYTNGTPALRYMTNPSQDGVSADCWYSSLGGLDVHYSSGVANHFFYLLAEGTTNGSPSKTCVAGNTRVATGTGTLTGIGRSKAEKIWYRALTVYMTSSTNYAAARTATLNAANDLYGGGSAESTAVAAAWTAVNRP